MGVPQDLPKVDGARAKEIWAEYQRQHEVSQLKGKAVGIDPVTEQVFFGDSAAAIATRLREEGQFRPLFFLRVGYDYYIRKGARR
jgi:hypothetical protein